MSKGKKISRLYLVALALFVLISLAYSNHFPNGFYFDDYHTIVENNYIRDISKIPSFFTDIASFGTMPHNRGYRPIVTSLNAIDYWLAGGLNPTYFHASIFASYILLLVLLFSLFSRIFDTTSIFKSNKWVALLAVGFYGVHAANAETINYIISRSDSFSTLCIVASLLLFTTKVGRKYYLYLVTLMLAIFTKEVGVVFAPILFFYILLFEENVSLVELCTLKKRGKVFRALRKTVPAVVLAIGLFYLTRNNFFIQDESTALLTASGESTPLTLRWKYFYSQWVVIVHYIGNFILPIDLSADPDLTYAKSIFDKKVLLSLVLILSMVITAFITSKKKETRPIAFGILWFFIALAPTSTFHPLGQFANDHRTFLPYIGLVISLAWTVKLIYVKYADNKKLTKQLIATGSALYLVLVSLHAYGTYQRNIVWSSEETLWKDASTKSPENGRALMNYGLVLMQKGQFEETLPYFEKTLEKLPNWAYIHINMGILKNAMGDPVEAEIYFKNAIRVQPLVPDCYIFYARYLKNQGRLVESINLLEEGQRISPAHVGIKDQLTAYKAESSETVEDVLQKIANSLPANPNVADYINQSLAYYNIKAFDKCIEACEKALQLDPNSALAYNNICSAYNSLKEWEKAAKACEAALKIDPNFERAKGNLNWSLQNISK